MKINDVPRVNAINPYKQANDARLAQAEVKKQKKKDEVNISSEAKELQVFQGSNPNIEDLKHSYNTGTYLVDASKVAEKLYPFIK